MAGSGQVQNRRTDSINIHRGRHFPCCPDKCSQIKSIKPTLPYRALHVRCSFSSADLSVTSFPSIDTTCSRAETLRASGKQSDAALMRTWCLCFMTWNGTNCVQYCVNMGNRWMVLLPSTSCTTSTLMALTPACSSRLPPALGISDTQIFLLQPPTGPGFSAKDMITYLVVNLTTLKFRATERITSEVIEPLCRP